MDTACPSDVALLASNVEASKLHATPEPLAPVASQDIDPPIENASRALGQVVQFSQLTLEERIALFEQFGETKPVPAQGSFQFEEDAEIRKQLDEMAIEAERVTKWSHVARVQLHIALLRALRTLHEDQTPLAEIIDLAQWISSDADENVPFSFARCIVVAIKFAHLLPSDAFDGLHGLEPDRAAEAIRVSMRPLIHKKLADLPDQIRKEVLEAPDTVIARLDADPQWLNKQLMRRLHGRTMSLLDAAQ